MNSSAVSVLSRRSAMRPLVRDVAIARWRSNAPSQVNLHQCVN